MRASSSGRLSAVLYDYKEISYAQIFQTTRLFLPLILGAPDIALPIGDVPCESRITGRTEYLPVVMDLVAAPGNH